MSRYLVERLNPTFGYFYKAGKTLHRGKTKWQEMEIIESEEFGNVLLLDGVTQVTSKNEFLYHEPMVHPVLCTHPDPKDVLIIGAGDGGILREVLKHPVDKAVMAELDGGVVEFCEELMPEINDGAFADKRYRLEVGDGRAFVKNTSEKFDAVIMDMTDPFGPSVMLYTKEFFEEVKATFKDERGCFVMHTESPIARPNTFMQCHHTLSQVFKFRRTFYLYIHMYAVLWSITVCSDTLDAAEISPAEIAKRLKDRGISGLKAYTPSTHHSMLGEFPFIGELLAKKHTVPVITDGKPVVLDDIDINRGSLDMREVSAKPAKAAAKKKPAKKAPTKAKKAAPKKAAKPAKKKAGKKK
jgi:spermidine synthase